MRMPGWLEKSIAAFFFGMICMLPNTNTQGPAFNYKKCSNSMAVTAECEGEKILAIKDWPAGGDQEDTGLPGIAVETPANFLCRTGRSLPLLRDIPILQQFAIGLKEEKCANFQYCIAQLL